MDIASDDGDNNPTVESFVYDFYKQQAENPRAEYPEIYVGDHVPTLGEARGKLKAQNSYEPAPYIIKKVRFGAVLLLRFLPKLCIIIGNE